MNHFLIGHGRPLKPVDDFSAAALWISWGRTRVEPRLSAGLLLEQKATVANVGLEMEPAHIN